MDEIMIDGVVVTQLRQIYHPKGNVYHAMKCTDSGFEGFGEAYFSTITHGLVKAWKRHSRMTLNLVCIVGKIHFVLCDRRENSLTFGKFMEVTLSPNAEQTYNRLTVPPGVWMAFVGAANDYSILLNIANIPHDSTEQVNLSGEECGIAFDFNSINIE
jgi:dTDP-4-dehydrorhamnose 3,5-epimerase